MINRIFIPIFILGLFIGCANYGQLTYTAKLPNALDENSGIAYFDDSGIWVVEDSGNSEELYKVDFDGNTLKKLHVKNVKNHDWEDLALDSIGNLYIGDFGNNGNKRDNLAIYKLPNPDTEKGAKIDAQKIRFRYPEQSSYPPNDSEMFYDAEAFFHLGSNLYIITKNRSIPFTGTAHIYKIPDSPGTYDAEFIGLIKTCDDWKTCQITSADISSTGKKIVLLSYGKLFVITDFIGEDFASGKMVAIDLGVRTQLESVCFKNDSTLLISDEEKRKSGRNLYTFKLPN